jgi:serine/threonine protein kinase
MKLVILEKKDSKVKFQNNFHKKIMSAVVDEGFTIDGPVSSIIPERAIVKEPTVFDLLGHGFGLSKLDDDLIVCGHDKEDDLVLKLGNFNLAFGEILGAGAYGVVNRATLGVVDVAVKTPSETCKLSEKDLRKEFYLMQLCSHRNVIRPLAVFRDGSKIDFVMELAGQSLSSKVEQFFFYTRSEQLEMARQLLDGFSHMHSLRVLHRDIKPLNLLEGLDNIYKIADFGTAEQLPKDGDVISGKLVGSPGFGSPEAVRQKYSKKTDVFALGMSFYYLFNGRFPLGMSKIKEPVALIFYMGTGKYQSEYDEHIVPRLSAMEGTFEGLICRMIHWNQAERPEMADARKDVSLK